MNILVTGGAGYIGNMISSLALEKGHKVRVVDLLWFKSDVPMVHLANPRYEFIRGDISDASIVEKSLEGIDFVVHAAAVVGEPASKKFPGLTKRINFQASLDLIKAAKVELET